MNAWVDVCALDDIPVLGARRVRRADGVEIAFFRTGSDEVFALLDRCPHRGGPLSQGIVFGNRVACPLHNWSIELDSGCAVAPDQGATQRFAVQVRDRRVLADLSNSQACLPAREDADACRSDHGAN
jgi:nitrite reductase (NADH) small subunit